MVSDIKGTEMTNVSIYNSNEETNVLIYEQMNERKTVSDPIVNVWTIKYFKRTKLNYQHGHSERV